MAVGTVLGVLFHKQWQYKRGWLFREGSISTKRELVSFRNLAEMYWEVGELLLDTPDGLDLGGLGVRTPLSPVLVVSTVVVRLQDVLVATVPGILVAHPAGRKGQRGKQGGSRGSPPAVVAQRWQRIVPAAPGPWPVTYAPHWIFMEPTSLLAQPMACSEG